MRQRRGRVHGPYPNRGGFRVVVVTRAGKRLARVLPTEREAHEWITLVRLELDQEETTVSDAIERYGDHKRDQGVQEQSIATSRYRLRALFKGELDMLVCDLTERRCQAAYDRLREDQEVDTHRNTLYVGRAFLAWCVSRHMSSQNPLVGVEGVGRRKRGKEQLRIDEARRLLATALERAGEGDRGALATAIVLLLGVRASEVAAIQARDVDDRGSILVIPRSKTEAGVRRLDIPPVLQVAMAPLLPDVGPLFRGEDRHWVLRQVKRLCRMARVPEVSAHGLRGTHASLAADRGASGQVVAASLGHADDGRTADRHYIAPGVAEAASRRAALRILEGGR